MVGSVTMTTDDWAFVALMLLIVAFTVTFVAFIF